MEAMTPVEFIAKWRASELKESSAAQEHFIDLCRLLGDRLTFSAAPGPTERRAATCLSPSRGLTVGSSNLETSNAQADTPSVLSDWAVSHLAMKMSWPSSS